MFQNFVTGKRLTGFILLSIVAALILTMPLFAQTSNGTIAGVVTDQTGAAVVNATVTAKSLATGSSRSAQTNSVGAYRIESLIPGGYTLTAKAPSFATTSVQNVTVVGSTITSINAELKPGAASETVEVQASAEALQTESGELSHTIPTKEINSLPISSLNPYSLAATLPGVVTGAATNFSNGTNFTVNGVRSRDNNFLIEGQDNNDQGIHGQAFQPENLDAVQEVSIQTNAYAAEFGHGGGSVSNLILKSGTNAFHGAAWELFQSSALNSNDHFNNYPTRLYDKGKDHENIFGWSLGGPIVKDKAFFFASYQWDKYRASTTGGTLSVPSANGYAALQSLLATATTTQKAQINTLLQAYAGVRGVSNLNTIVLGAGRPDIEYGNVIREGIAANSDSPELDMKGDYMPTSKDTINLRFIKASYSSPYDLGNFPNQLPGFDTQQSGPSYSAGITYSRIIKPNLINELRVSYTRIGFTFGWRPDTISNPLVAGGTMPAVSITNLTGWGPPASTPQGRFHNTYQYQDSVSWQTGKHSFKFGADIADIRAADTIPISNYFGAIGYSDSTCAALNPTDPCFSLGAPVQATGLANFIDGYGGSASAAQTFGSNRVDAPFKTYNFFGQDTWKLRTNLTMTLGLRYEYTKPVANNIPYPAIDPANPAPANYPTRLTQQPDKSDFGPRLGFAYTPHILKSVFGEDKTVIRAGAGIFYNGIFGNILDNIQSGAPNDVPASFYSVPVSSTDPRGTANWYWANEKPLLSPVLNPYASVSTITYNLKNPRVYQWNLDVQRELPGHFTLVASYVGTRGEHLFSQSVLNPVAMNPLKPICGGGQTYCRIIANRGSITTRDNSGDSIYHGLQVSLNSRAYHGLTLRTNYTWSKAIDDGSEIFTPGTSTTNGGNYSSYSVVQGIGHGVFDRAVASFDRRQRLVFAYTYEVPKLKAASFSENPVFAAFGNIYNGWQISGTSIFQSGAPGNVQIGTDWNWDGISNDRPMMGDPSAPITSWGVDNGSGQICDGPTWYYKSHACTVVAANTVHWVTNPYITQQANVIGRNAYVSPGSQTWTFALTKSIKLGEKQKLDFRTEMFNPFNHANTGVPNLTLITGGPNPKSPSFIPTLGNLALTSNGYRSIRMMLKYSF
jgi:hypothetical protein